MIVGVSIRNKVWFERFNKELLHIRSVEVAKIPANPVPVLKYPIVWLGKLLMKPKQTASPKLCAIPVKILETTAK